MREHGLEHEIVESTTHFSNSQYNTNACSENIEPKDCLSETIRDCCSRINMEYTSDRHRRGKEQQAEINSRTRSERHTTDQQPCLVK